jgi:hypothetical protein
MLLSMLFTAFITAIFHEIAATLLQFDVIHSCDAAVSTHILIGLFLEISKGPK